ncbi:unnamed protein product, partial [marine sediment metagenome]
PSNSTLGNDTLHTFTINDNDNAGYSGPGGVGDSDNNKLWIRAEDLGLSNNDPVTSWIDTSGNGNDFSQSTGSLQPSFQTSQLNSFPAVCWFEASILPIPARS